jgi:hypothetical protein
MEIFNVGSFLLPYLHVQPALAKAQYTRCLCGLLVDKPYKVSQLLLVDGW